MSFGALSADPRDKVYGILSLLSSAIRDRIPVDYSLDYLLVLDNVIQVLLETCSHLNIITGARLPADANRWTACTFGIDECEKLFRPNTSPAMGLIGLKAASILHHDIPWAPRTVAARMLKEGIYPPDSAGTDLRERSVVTILPTQRPQRQFLPRLSVRAHFIDFSHGSMHENARAFVKAISLDFKDHHHAWIHKFFRTPALGNPDEWPEEWLDDSDAPETAGVSKSPAPYAHYTDACLQLNEVDLQAFIADVNNHVSSEKARVFHTVYSVGFSDSSFIAGDSVFAIDGASEPLLLRMIGDGVYRIVGSCYLWAALELDYWVPNSRKGLWPDRPYHFECQQTQMIEIY